MRTRVLSAAVLAPVALACAWFGGVAWLLLITAASAGMAWEWGTISRAGPRWAVMPGVSLAVLASGFAPMHVAIGILIVAAGIAWSGSRTAAVGVAYVGLGGIALVLLRADPAVGRANLLFLVFVVWASDIAAYAAGRLFGGPKLAPRISPGKTWSGSVGGLLGAGLVGAAVAQAFAPGHAIAAAWVAMVLAAAGQAGDLLESAIKRRFGVKDSGQSIPGHGGLLDRLDGFLTATPVAVLLALWLGRGVEVWR